MIPSLAKQFTADERRFLGKLRERRQAEQAQATIPSLGKRPALVQTAAQAKTPDARRAWPLVVPLPLLPPPLPGMLEAAAAAYFIKDLDRTLDPFPRGKSWYGNYTGPGNERRDWEEDHLEPQTPLDRGPMQHDQEYSNLEEKYGYGHYETDPDGKRRFKGDEGSFLTMRFDTEHEGIHLGLIGADTRLMWRSGWYPAVGLTEGKYDLTFSKGSRGAESLVTDVLVAGVILQVFPILIAVDVTFLEITVGRHLLEGLGEAGFRLGKELLPYYRDSGKPLDLSNETAAIRDYKPFPHATMGSMWRQVGPYRIGGSGYLFGNKQLPYEIGMRNTTVADIASFLVTPGIYGLLTGTATLAEFAVAKAFGWLVHETSAGFISGSGAPPCSERAGGAEYYGQQLVGGAEYYGGQASGAAHYYGRQASGGVKYYGGRLNSGAKSAGRKASDWSKRAGGALSGGAKSAGGKLSDAWKDLGGGLGGGGGGGGGSGGCFLTTACARSLAEEEAQRVLDGLRAFRDRVLLRSAAGRALVDEYYGVAPAIVRRIDASADPRSEYRHIYRSLVRPTFEQVTSGRFAAAVALYRRGVEELVAKWHIEWTWADTTPVICQR